MLRDGVCCQSRQTAEDIIDFWYAPRLGGFVMREPPELGSPMRHPFVWHFCPWCGSDLPGCEQPSKPDDAQSNPYKDTDD